MTQPLRLLIVDDHEVVRMGLRALLDAEPDMTVVAEAATAQEALEMAQRHRPDVAVVDVRLPGTSGLELCRELRQRYPRTQVVILTSFLTEELVTQALRAGASGYVLKDVSTDELLRAIRAAAQGKTALDPLTAQHMVSHLRRLEMERQAQAFEGLSQREMQVLALVAQGLSNREIGERLYLSEGTVRNYVSNIMEKLGLRNRIELATYAVAHHIFDFIEGLDEENPDVA